MALYDSDNPISAEDAALWHTAALLSECSSFQTFAEKSTTAAARTKINIGRDDLPWDNDSFSEAQLADLFCSASLIATPGKLIMTGSGSPSAEQGGEFQMVLRRYVRRSEAADYNDVYLYVLGTIAAIEVEMIEDAEVRECPRLRWISRDAGPAYNALDEESAQGEYIWSKHTIAWGDEVEA